MQHRGRGQSRLGGSVRRAGATRARAAVAEIPGWEESQEDELGGATSVDLTAAAEDSKHQRREEKQALGVPKLVVPSSCSLVVALFFLDTGTLNIVFRCVRKFPPKTQ